MGVDIYIYDVEIEININKKKNCVVGVLMIFMVIVKFYFLCIFLVGLILE